MLKIDSALKMGGQPFVVEREEGGFEVTAIKDDEKKQFLLHPNSGVKPGDWLKHKITDKRFHVIDTDFVLVHEKPYCMTADFRTEADLEAERKLAATQVTTYNIQNAIASNIGNQTHAEVHANFTFGDLEAAVERRAEGEEREELLRMVREVRDLLENGQGLEPSSLEKYSEQINRHGWIAGPLATMILTYLVTGQFS